MDEKTKKNLESLKSEASSSVGVQFSDYNGNLSSKQCGSVGGEMVKKMVEQYENGLK